MPLQSQQPDTTTQKGGLAHKTVLMMGLTAASKVLGFIRNAVLASIFGVTLQTDAFYLSINMLSVFTGFIGSVTTSIVPLRTQMLVEQGQEAADRYSSIVLNLGIIIAAGLAALLFFLAEPMVSLFAPSFSGDAHILAVRFVRLMAPLIVFSSVYYVFDGILNTHQRFLPAHLAPFLLGAFWLVIPLLLVERFGIYSLVIGYSAGIIAQGLVYLPVLRKEFRYRFCFSFRDPQVIKTFLMGFPIFVGVASLFINQAVDQALASSQVVGSITALNYAFQLVSAVSAVISTPLVVSFYPRMARFCATDRFDEVKALLSRICSLLICLIVPVSALGLLFATPVVSFVYERGAFDSAATTLTSSVFMCYILSILPSGINYAIARCFYALQNTKTPMLIDVGITVGNVLISLLLVRYMGTPGIALGTGIAMSLGSVAYFVLIRRRFGPMGYRTLAVEAAKVLIASAAMSLVAWGCYTLLAGWPGVAALVAAVAAGLVVYAALLLLLRYAPAVQGLAWLRRALRQRLH